MNKRDKDRLTKIVREIMSIKYMMIIIDKLYRKEVITMDEHERMIKACKKEIDTWSKKGGLLWKKEK